MCFSTITKLAHAERADTQNHTFITARQSKRHQCPDDSKNILTQHRTDLSRRGIRSMDSQSGAGCRHDLLFFGARELAQNGLRDGCGGLDGEGVHEHV